MGRQVLDAKLCRTALLYFLLETETERPQVEEDAHFRQQRGFSDRFLNVVDGARQVGFLDMGFFLVCRDENNRQRARFFIFVQ